MNKQDCHVSCMIFTLDEEINLPHCLGSLQWCDDIIVIDSGSQDRTEQIAKDQNARVFYRKFDGFGSQRNWAIKNSDPKHDWILILDADERVPDELAKEINKLAKTADETIGAARVRRRFHMWGKWLRYSSLYPTWVVRLVHKDRVEYINRGHAETQSVQGETLALENDLIDENHKGIDYWYERQRRYAKKDAEYEIEQAGKELKLGEVFSSDPLVKKMALKRLSWKMPGRDVLYFLYSYLLKGGFRDGMAGLRFCLMRASYQRMVVRAKREIR